MPRLSRDTGRVIRIKRNKATGKMMTVGKPYFKPRGRKVQVLSNLNPIPARQIVRMKYSQAFATAIGGAYNYQFALNSIYDPDQSGVGHQPYGHDQLATLYNRYRVIGCKYTVTAFSGSTGIRFGVVPANEVKTFTTLGEVAENPRAQVRTQYPGSSISKISGYVSCPKITGRTADQYMADDRYQATFGSNPAEIVALNCTALDLAEIGTTVNWTITLEYLVEVFDVKPLSQS